MEQLIATSPLLQWKKFEGILNDNLEEGGFAWLWYKCDCHWCKIIFINFNITIIQEGKLNGIEIVKIKCKMVRDDGRMRQGLEMNDIECGDD